MSPPWSLLIQDEAPLTLVSVVEGSAWIGPGGGDWVRLQHGDVAIVRGPDPYVVADDPSTEPTVVIHPDQRCTTPTGESLADVMHLGVRTWGNRATGSTTMLTGTYTTDGEVSRRLLDALPTLVTLRHDRFDGTLVRLLAAEVGHDEPGQSAVLDRLLDLLLISALRTWLADAGADAPTWYHAHADPLVAHAVRLLHADPARPWTVADLAASVGASRAALARRFNAAVGEPPMTYLTGWRLALAADHLRADPTVTEVSRRVGYQSPFTFSTAFKRAYGVSPKRYRDQHGNGPQGSGAQAVR